MEKEAKEFLNSPEAVKNVDMRDRRVGFRKHRPSIQSIVDRSSSGDFETWMASLRRRTSSGPNPDAPNGGEVVVKVGMCLIAILIGVGLYREYASRK